MKNYIIIFYIFLGIQISAQQKITVWSKGQMPNSKGLKLKIEEEEKEGRITQIKEAELFAFLPAKEERKQMAVIIIPGGGYHHLTYDLGGYSYAKWLNTLGISAFVLNYRLPTSPDLKQKEIGPLQDIQASIKLIRKNAAQYGISPNLIGVLGTSAGGHLAAMVSNLNDITKLKGDWESISTIPDFAILVSPVIDLGEFAHKGSRINLLGENASAEKVKEYSMQNRVAEKTPTTILFHAQNDPAVPVINSILYYEAMLKNKVKGVMFIFPEGEHNIGISNKSELTDNWKKLCSDWLKTIIK